MKFSKLLIVFCLIAVTYTSNSALAQTQACNVGSVNITPSEVTSGQQLTLTVVGQGTCTGWGVVVNVRCGVGGNNVFSGSTQNFTASQTQLQWSWTTPATNPCAAGAMRESFSAEGVVGNSRQSNTFFINFNVAASKYLCRNGACVADPNGSFTDPSCSNLCSTGGGGQSVSGNYQVPDILGVSSVAGLIDLISRWIFNISIPIVVGLIIYAGVLFIVAAGDQGKVKSAREILKWAVVGLAIVLIGRGFVTLIVTFLQGP